MKNLASTTDKDQMIRRIYLLKAQSQRQWGTMTVEQMLAHCSEQLRICLGEVPSKPRATGFRSKLLKWVGLYAPMKMPKNLRTIKEMDASREIMTKSISLEEDRRILVQLIDRLYQLPDSQACGHPIFGKLSKRELGILTYKHFDHHLRQFGV